MQFTVHGSLKGRQQGELLVLPFFQSKDKDVLRAAEFPDSLVDWHLPVNLKDFKAAPGEVMLLYAPGEKEKRIALIGLGDAQSLTIEGLRRAYAQLTKMAGAKKLSSVNILLPQLSPKRGKKNPVDDKALLRGIVEGVLLANYSHDIHKHDRIKDVPTVLIDKLGFIGADRSALPLLKNYAEIFAGVLLARNLVNGNADEVNPQYLCTVAKDLAKEFPSLKCTILGKKEIQKEKMGLLLAVNRGSARDPALIQLSYQGNENSPACVLLIGKGVTYDTGGLNLKPTGSMETMKCDMGGAAAVLGAIRVAAALKLPVNVVALIPTTENCIDAHSYKPGDTYQSYSGKTVEIGNTDAEGRLILADAITYGKKHCRPTMIIDLATLTGAIDIALGPEVGGLFSNDESLCKRLLQAGDDTSERLWHMPLVEEYRDLLKSDVADMKNVGGRSAGAITAALFLEEFIGKGPKSIPWAHLDIASVAYLSDSKRYHPKGATGFGVRLLTAFLEQL
jgi:leucyl aminopeptidase